MIELTVPDMTCGGCARGVTTAIKSVDPRAEVVIDLASHKVQVTTTAGSSAVKAAVAGAGFSPA
ncbi:MAG: copper chaperone [Rhodobacter sp.]|nr:copper chaperone [Rhodobacter sp.]